jgi:CheY-like chemotaxis protein
MVPTLRDHPPCPRYVATEQAPPRVLLADDDSDILKLISCALRGRGFEIAEACDGAELLSQVFAQPFVGGAERPPDIIVTDVRMPGFTGLEILAALRQANLRTAVVLMTAYADLQTRVLASELGVDAFFAKPFDVHELLRVVVNLTPMPTGSRGD